jgi:3-hydroxyacyl-[acyl-carrier-protein] dehydratase
MFLNDLYHIMSMDSREEERLITVRLNPEHRIYGAHFPGNPITPGACLLEMARELASVVLNKELLLEKADNVKFLKGIHPGEHPLIIFRLHIKGPEDRTWKVRTEIMEGETLMTRMNLCLKETIPA